jgi:hypothetical protein
MMAVREMSVMAGLFMVSRFVVLGRQQMVLGSFLVVFRCLAMMIGAFVRHGAPLSWI